MYTVHVITGDFTGGGTDANVFITVFGNKGDSGERPLSKSETHRDKFEKGNVSLLTCTVFSTLSSSAVRLRGILATCV